MYVCVIIHVHTEERLPAVNLMYYVFPASELEPLARDGHLHQRANLPTERIFSLVKAITISLDIPEHQHDLVWLYSHAWHTRCFQSSYMQPTLRKPYRF